MNGAYIAIGGGLIAIGGALIAQSKKSEDPTVAKNRRLSGILMMCAGATFMATGVVLGR